MEIVVDTKFVFEEKCRPHQAKDLILTLAKYGSHEFRRRFESDADVKRFLEAHGLSFDSAVEACLKRDGSPPAWFINYIERGPWTTFGTGVSLSTAGMTMVGSGQIITHGYYSTWKASYEAFERSMDKGSYIDFLVAATLGVASIEAYLNFRADIYNESVEPESRLIDCAERPIKFDRKITEWVRIASGANFLRGHSFWEAFRRIRKLRDDQLVHPKASGFAVTFGKMQEFLSDYQIGICEFHIALHKHFDDEIGYWLARAAYAPSVKLVNVTLQVP